jgi:hypothetical protein
MAMSDLSQRSVFISFSSLLNVAIHFAELSQLHLNKIMLFCPMVIEVRHSPNLVPMVMVKNSSSRHCLCCCFLALLTRTASQAGKDLGVK